jgi:hypothetical protein
MEFKKVLLTVSIIHAIKESVVAPSHTPRHKEATMTRVFTAFLLLFCSFGGFAEEHVYTFPKKLGGDRIVTMALTYEVRVGRSYSMQQKRTLVVGKARTAIESSAGKLIGDFAIEQSVDGEALVETATAHIKVSAGGQIVVPDEILRSANNYGFDEIETGRGPEKGGFFATWTKGGAPFAKNLKLEVRK